MTYFPELLTIVYARNSLISWVRNSRWAWLVNSHFFLPPNEQLKEGIFVNQGKHVCELLKKYKIDNAKHASTPMASSTKLDQDPEGKPINEKLYRGMIGSLLYLIVSYPDIMCGVCLCARFQSSPNESYLTAVKWIFWYLAGTKNFGLWYPRGVRSLSTNRVTEILQAKGHANSSLSRYSGPWGTVQGLEL